MIQETTHSDSHASWTVSLAFWLALLAAIGAYSLVALSPKLVSYIQLRHDYQATQMRLVSLEHEVDDLNQVVDSLSRDRIAILLSARTGSLPTDVTYWEGRDAVGGLSPTLFTYTLPSAAIGEIAIRHRITGPNLCFVGDDRDLLREANDFLRRNEADACVCVFVDLVSTALTKVIGASETAQARAMFVRYNDSSPLQHIR